MNEWVQEVLLSKTPAALVANCSHSDKRWWWCYWFPLLALTAGWSWPPGWPRRSVITDGEADSVYFSSFIADSWGGPKLMFFLWVSKKKTRQHRSTTRPSPPCWQKHWVKEGVQHLATCLLTHSLSSLCSDKMLGRLGWRILESHSNGWCSEEQREEFYWLCLWLVLSHSVSCDVHQCLLSNTENNQTPK